MLFPTPESLHQFLGAVALIVGFLILVGVFGPGGTPESRKGNGGGNSNKDQK